VVQHKAAMELMLTGDPISAQRAYEVGLVNRVVPWAELMSTATAYVERIVDNALLVLAMMSRYAQEVTPKGPAEEENLLCDGTAQELSVHALVGATVVLKR